MTDGHEHITWCEIICYFETIDLWVMQRNKYFRSIPSAINCNMLANLLHCNDTIDIQSTLTPKKKNMTWTPLWDGIVLHVRFLRRRLWKHTASLNFIHHHPNISEKDEYIILFLGRYFYAISLHYIATQKKAVQLICEAVSYPSSRERHLQMTVKSNGKSFSPGAVFHVG